MTLTDTLDHLLSVFLRPLRSWIEREVVAPLRAAYDAAMQTKEQYRDGVYLHLRERLEGTDEHPLAEGVPVRPLPAVQDLAHLQEAVELLGERKIEDASPDIPDGVSLLRILGDSTLAATITELVDTNKGWTMKDTDLFTLFPNLSDITLACVEINSYIANNKTSLTGVHFPYCKTINCVSSKALLYNIEGEEEMTFPELEVINFGSNSNAFGKFNACKRLYFPKLTEMSRIGNANVLDSFPILEELYMPKLEGNTNALGHWPYIICNNQTLKKVIVGNIKYFSSSGGTCSIFFENCPNLIYLEIAEGVNATLYFNYWSPTMSLRTDTTASDYIDLREDKDEQGEFINATNLEQFLSNFKNYIADRLADRTGQSTLTLTLSQAVRDVLTAEIEEIIVTNKHWVISPAKSV